jgi:hypothetical protein
MSLKLISDTGKTFEDYKRAIKILKVKNANLIEKNQ